MSAVTWLPVQPVGFPDPREALEEPDGLLAAGGALDRDWLLEAYSHGIFPWFDSDDQPILWWSPSRRAVLEPGAMRVPRSLKKTIRHAGYSVSWDTDFAAVIRACGGARRNASGTWITPHMRAAYEDLHRSGYAHSVEVWHDAELVGGLYGVSLGRMFFGESMFSHASDASKVAFFNLQDRLHAWQFELIDCQIMNPHLASLGVSEVSRSHFLRLLDRLDPNETRCGLWCL